MKNEKQQQAEELFFQTDLSKTQIANVLGISRRTLHYWIRENNWARLKKSAAHLPTMLAENCYLMMGHLSTSILSEDRVMRPVTRHEAETLHKLMLTISKLKKGAALNESMEMFAYFMEEVHSKDPELAKQIQPFVNAHIQARAAVHPSQFMPDKLNNQGYFPMPSPKDDEEARLDAEDLMAWSMENEPIIDVNEFATSEVRHCEERSPSERLSRAGNLGAATESTTPDLGGAPNPSGPDYAELLQQDREDRARRFDSILHHTETILKNQPKEAIPPAPQPVLSGAEGERAGVRPNRKQRRAIAAREAKAKTRIAA